MFNFFKRLFLRQHSCPEDIPKKLDPGTMAKVLDEARVLHGQHHITIQPLTKGEIPIPRRADES